MRTADFDFELPPELIAQEPVTERDQSRLLVVDRRSGRLAHRQFRDIVEYFRAGDVLVLNNSRVLPARLRGVNAQSGGRFEILLLEETGSNHWWVMLRPGRRARVGTRIQLLDREGRPTEIRASVLETNVEGHRHLRFVGVPEISSMLERIGEVPLPPYINRIGRERLAEDLQRYQTVYARPPGSVAAPTAGLHFTEALLDGVRGRGVEVVFVTLHVGLGTFAPVKTESIAAHPMHEERYEVSEATARAVNAARSSGRRVVAVGTTSVRVLESVARQNQGRLAAGPGRTSIFIYPPFEFQMVGGLLTNFHLPRSTLLMLVSAFATPGDTHGRALVLSAYATAIRERYRFFSYGDAMLLV